MDKLRRETPNGRDYGQELTLPTRPAGPKRPSEHANGGNQIKFM